MMLANVAVSINDIPVNGMLANVYVSINDIPVNGMMLANVAVSINDILVNGMLANVDVSIDVTWQKRGHSSKHGVIFLVSVEIGGRC